MPAATAAAAPPLDPPGGVALFQGLCVIPVRSDSVVIWAPNSGVVVLPMVIRPARANRSVRLESYFDTLPFSRRLPHSYGVPFICAPMSVRRNGTTEKGPC